MGLLPCPLVTVPNTSRHTAGGCKAHAYAIIVKNATDLFALLVCKAGCSRMDLPLHLIIYSLTTPTAVTSFLSGCVTVHSHDYATSMWWSPWSEGPKSVHTQNCMSELEDCCAVWGQPLPLG